MTDITYVVGDVTTAKERLVAHGCNSHGVMGSGVARAVWAKWPGTYDEYHRVWEAAVKDGQAGLTLGDVIWTVELAEGYYESLPKWVLHMADTDAARIVANCITQRDFGAEPGRVYVDYDAVARSFTKLNALAVLYGLDGIAMPRIGCGLAQGTWDCIEPLIHSTITACGVTVYDWPPP